MVSLHLYPNERRSIPPDTHLHGPFVADADVVVDLASAHWAMFAIIACGSPKPVDGDSQQTACRHHQGDDGDAKARFVGHSRAKATEAFVQASARLMKARRPVRARLVG